MDYLSETRPSQSKETGDWPSFLIELARLEWVIYEVFDAPGMENSEPLQLPVYLSVDLSQ